MLPDNIVKYRVTANGEMATESTHDTLLGAIDAIRVIAERDIHLYKSVNIEKITWKATDSKELAYIELA